MMPSPWCNTYAAMGRSWLSYAWAAEPGLLDIVRHPEIIDGDPDEVGAAAGQRGAAAGQFGAAPSECG